MGEKKTPEKDEWHQMLVENGVPQHIAKEATMGEIDLRPTQRQIWTFLALMFALMSIVAGAFLMLTKEVCDPGVAINRMVAMVSAMCAAMCAAGIFMGRRSLRAPISTRKSLFVGAFNNPKSLPYLQALTAKANGSPDAVLSFDTYDQFITARSMVWFRWPLYAFAAISILSFFLLPANCP